MKLHICLAVLTAMLSCASARGQAMLTFGTNSSGRLTLTLSQSVQYTVTASTTAGPIFFFENVGSQLSTQNLVVTGTITYSIGDGAATSPMQLKGTNTAPDGVYTPTSPFIFNGGALTTLNVGDTVLLKAGTLTTNDPYTGDLPLSGTYDTIIGDAFGNQLSANGMAVPEPSTWALLGLGVVAGMRLAPRRRATRV